VDPKARIIEYKIPGYPVWAGLRCRPAWPPIRAAWPAPSGGGESRRPGGVPEESEGRQATPGVAWASLAGEIGSGRQREVIMGREPDETAVSS